MKYDVNFSVVIPLYNKAYSIERCLASVCNQTTPPDEIIVIDDGSTDDSYFIVSDFKEQCPEALILLISQKNAGVSVARNKGVSLASNDYICFLDADDEWRPFFLKVMSELIEDFPSAVLYCLGHEVKKDGACLFRPKHGCEETFRGYVDDFFKASSKGSVANSSKVCVTKESLEQVNGFPEGISAGEDLYLWIMLALNGSVVCFSKPCSIVHQVEDFSRNDREGSVPYPIIFFGNHKNYLVKYKSLVCYLSRIGLRHVAGSIRSGNYNEAFRRSLALRKISLRSFFFSLLLFLIPSTLFKKMQQ